MREIGRGGVVRWGGVVGACASALALALGAWQGTTHSQASAEASAAIHCPPVVTTAGKAKFSKASVLIVEREEVDCEKARKTIYRALSATPYRSRRIGGWTCKSTRRAGPAEPYGAMCGKDEPREVIRSTTPHRCGSCRHVRD